MFHTFPRIHSVRFLIITVALACLASWATFLTYSHSENAKLNLSRKASASKEVAAERSDAAKPDDATRACVSETYGNLPLSFEANQGLLARSVKYLSRGSGYSLFLTPTEAEGRFELPSLQGEAAIEELKQQGLYDSLSAAMTAARYKVHAQPEAGEFAAANPAQQLHAGFTADGLALSATLEQRTQRVALQLRGVGYGQRLLAVSPGTLSAQADRVELQRKVGSGAEDCALDTPHSPSGMSTVRPASSRASRSTSLRALATLRTNGWLSSCA